ncbi:Global transcription regulator FGP1 [Choanephora cucurbitarum]|uniref:Global transcription regulator FGP1 n=1 Tax=Choanephora cucurbitarum TaxID=101091 RepID=A0A1C7NR30_9FUNG|nr:Global transcription regulator FGP1 [Choanephora cucurbitarum]
MLPRITRRLQEKERQLVRSGSIFVFDETESGIKRWTDGRIWSPSRIMGNFLVYRELNKKHNAKQSIRKLPSDPSSRTRNSLDQMYFQRTRERQLVGSLSDHYNFKEDGLIKKTMSVVVHGSPLHLISYYYPDDVLQRRLRIPSVVPELANLDISPELLSRQNFRIPPMVEADNSNDFSQANNSNTMLSPIYDHHMSLHSHPVYSSQIGLPPTPTHSTPNTPLPSQISRHRYPSLSTPTHPVFTAKESSYQNPQPSSEYYF